MSAKVRIKTGSVELEYETDAAISIEDIRALLDEVEQLGPLPAESAERAGKVGAEKPDSASSGKAGGSQKLFVTSIAAKLGVKSAADLAKAAAAQLQLIEGKESFTRQELLLTMRKATMYYKSNMRKNLSSIIASLIPDALNQISEEVYSLTAAEYADLEAKLA